MVSIWNSCQHNIKAVAARSPEGFQKEKNVLDNILKVWNPVLPPKILMCKHQERGI